MFKRTIRWILPILVLAIIVAYFVVAPIRATHAATTIPSSTSTSTPDVQWGYP